MPSPPGRGVGGAAGKPLPLSPKTIERLMDMDEMAAAFSDRVTGRRGPFVDGQSPGAELRAGPDAATAQVTGELAEPAADSGANWQGELATHARRRIGTTRH